MAEYMLELKEVCKTFYPGTPNERRAMDSLSLRLERGEFVTIIGSNGAGKSTLFNAICGSFSVDSGAIMLDGMDITYMKDYKRAYGIGRLFQDPAKGTAPNMTIEENLSLAYSRSAGRSFFAVNKRDRDFFRGVLAMLGMGLEDRMKTKIGRLSGGQRQAVSLLMSTISKPKLLLLDEHTAALDPQSAKKVLDITKSIVREGNITTMMITHDVNAALALGSRTIMMNAGKIALDIAGEEREGLSAEDALRLYSLKSGERTASDRMLFSLADKK